MTSFFISPFKPPEWYGQSDFEIDPADFVNRLKSRWPTITIRMNSDSSRHLLEWEGVQNDRFIRGALQANRQIISLDGSSRELAEFVSWYRGLIPSKYRLFFFHESLYTSIEVVSDTSLDELIKSIEQGTG